MQHYSRRILRIALQVLRQMRCLQCNTCEGKEGNHGVMIAVNARSHHLCKRRVDLQLIIDHLRHFEELVPSCPLLAHLSAKLGESACRDPKTTACNIRPSPLHPHYHTLLKHLDVHHSAYTYSPPRSAIPKHHKFILGSFSYPFQPHPLTSTLTALDSLTVSLPIGTI